MSDTDDSEHSSPPAQDPSQNYLFQQYGGRCSICLNAVDEGSGEYMPIISPEDDPLELIAGAIELGMLPPHYAESAESRTNGTIQCPTCRDYFGSKIVVLCLPTPVIKYIHSYITSTPLEEREPMHKVFDLLLGASEGHPASTLPDPSAVLPYLGLFTIAAYRPKKVGGRAIATDHLPPPSMLDPDAGHFLQTPVRTPRALRPGMVRIFEPLAVQDEEPRRPGKIMLSAGNTGSMYWHLPVLQHCAVLASFIGRLDSPSQEESFSAGHKNIKLAIDIWDLLDLERLKRLHSMSFGDDHLRERLNDATSGR